MSDGTAVPASQPRIGVVASHPIQYQAPLYQLLTRRARVELDVLFVTDDRHSPLMDPGFGVPVAWDVDLLSGYEHRFLTRSGRHSPASSRLAYLARWIPAHDAVVIHGHSEPWMLLAALLCRVRQVPYLLRGESAREGQATGLRRHLRNALARLVVSGSAAGLAIGRLNEEFYRHFGAQQIIWAPYSVDDERFAATPPTSRRELLSRWHLDYRKPVVMFCGKLCARKRPLDLCAAVNALARDVNVVFAGDGELADEVRTRLRRGCGVVTGFINQSELPCYYHMADILVLPSEHEPWGVVVNEAMAAGVIPVVSDRVGAAPDLVAGVGQVYPCGDTARLAEALSRALDLVGKPETGERVRHRVARYNLERTAIGFEMAARIPSCGSQS
jgi:glycosyltransferase involved in cell wall biosynthesis